jgi:hypothetical protein
VPAGARGRGHIPRHRPPRAFNPLSFRGGGEASAPLLSHRRVSSDRVCAKLQRRSSRQPRYSVIVALRSPIELARSICRLRHDAFIAAVHSCVVIRDCVFGTYRLMTIDRSKALVETWLDSCNNATGLIRDSASSIATETAVSRQDIRQLRRNVTLALS